MTQRLIRQEVGSKISVPRAELQKYYDEHKDEFMREERVFLSEILVSTAGQGREGDRRLWKRKPRTWSSAPARERSSATWPGTTRMTDTATNGGQLGAFAVEKI